MKNTSPSAVAPAIPLMAPDDPAQARLDTSVPDWHSLGAFHADLVEIRNGYLTAVRQVFDMRAGLLECQQHMIAGHLSKQRLRYLRDGGWLLEKIEDALQPQLMVAPNGVQTVGQIRHRLLVSTERERHAVGRHLAQRVQIVPDSCISRDAFRRLMRRGPRQDMIASKENI